MGNLSKDRMLNNQNLADEERKWYEDNWADKDKFEKLLCDISKVNFNWATRLFLDNMTNAQQLHMAIFASHVALPMFTKVIMGNEYLRVAFEVAKNHVRPKKHHLDFWRNCMLGDGFDGDPNSLGDSNSCNELTEECRVAILNEAVLILKGKEPLEAPKGLEGLPEY